MEAVLTLGLVSVILGTASGAQNIGIIGAFGVGAYIALAGLWGSPISGASMNPARTFGPDLVGKDFSDYWVYVAGPLVGAVLAVGAAWVLRGAGGGKAGSGAAQGAWRQRSSIPRRTDPIETTLKSDVRVFEEFDPATRVTAVEAAPAEFDVRGKSRRLPKTSPMAAIPHRCWKPTRGLEPRTPSLRVKNRHPG